MKEASRKLIQLTAVAAAAVALVVFVALGRPSAASSASSHGDTITVTGVGDATAAPDQASFDFVIDTTGGAARGAPARERALTHDAAFAPWKDRGPPPR